MVMDVDNTLSSAITNAPSMHLEIGTRLKLANLGILAASFAMHAPWLAGPEFGILLAFTLLTAVTSLALTPIAIHWVCLRDLDAIQAAVNGMKRGDYRVPLDSAPEPEDPRRENELNRLKREIHWMRRAIEVREQHIRRQAERVLAHNEALQIAANTDQLTGLSNTRCFWERLDSCFDDHARTGEPFAIVMLDIDFFKRINDTYGHPGGDRVLEEFARILRENTRKTDVAARIGGEEFALILQQSSPPDTQIYLQRLHCVLRECHIGMAPDTRIRITVSIGYCVVTQRPVGWPGEPSCAAEECVKRADDALYWVKNNGRDGIMAWHQLAADYREHRRRALPADVRQ